MNRKIDSKINSKIIVALDYADSQSAMQLVNQLEPSLCKLKVGKELFTAAGPLLVEKLIAKNYDVFLDLKFHDIPTTVKKACQAASNLGVWMLNVHASGGTHMMHAAAEGVDIGSQGNVHNTNQKPFLIAVTVLTSMNQASLNEIGINTPVAEHVLKLATLTQQAGLDGVVCSGLEAQLLKQYMPDNFLLVTPGIRPASEFNNQSSDDQSRVLTPATAIAMGASYLVIGRPVTQAANPIEVLMTIRNDIANIKD